MNTMTLTNPTDDELNAAFAEKVVKPNPIGKMWGDEYIRPDFINSFDALLPWLEMKEVVEVIYNHNPYIGTKGYSVQVSDAFTEDNKEPAGRSGWVNCRSLPRAACIALLRAHGVVVEVTK